MSLDPSINLDLDVLDEGPAAAEGVVIAWLRPLLPDGQVANTRQSGDPLPFVLVNHLDGNESIEESSVDDLVSVHCLYRKGLGAFEKQAADDFASRVHRRILKLGRELDPIEFGDVSVDIDFLEVASRPRWEAYGDDQILRKVGRYRIGLAYAKLS
jgi:hypothetical protein